MHAIKFQKGFQMAKKILLGITKLDELAEFLKYKDD